MRQSTYIFKFKHPAPPAIARSYHTSKKIEHPLLSWGRERWEGSIGGGFNFKSLPTSNEMKMFFTKNALTEVHSQKKKGKRGLKWAGIILKSWVGNNQSIFMETALSFPLFRCAHRMKRRRYKSRWGKKMLRKTLFLGLCFIEKKREISNLITKLPSIC